MFVLTRGFIFWFFHWNKITFPPQKPYYLETLFGSKEQKESHVVRLMQVFTVSHKENYQYHQWLSLRRTPLLLTEFISSRFEHCSCCCSVGGIALPSSLACSRIRFLQKVRFVLTQVTNWLYKNIFLAFSQYP